LIIVILDLAPLRLDYTVHRERHPTWRTQSATIVLSTLRVSLRGSTSHAAVFVGSAGRKIRISAV